MLFQCLRAGHAYLPFLFTRFLVEGHSCSVHLPLALYASLRGCRRSGHASFPSRCCWRLECWPGSDCCEKEITGMKTIRLAFLLILASSQTGCMTVRTLEAAKESSHKDKNGGCVKEAQPAYYLLVPITFAGDIAT